MAATFTERAQLAEDPAFIYRVRQALIKYVLYIGADSNLSNKQIRMVKSVIGAPDDWAKKFAVGAAQNDFVGDGTTQDPSVDSVDGDAALSSVIEGALWPVFIREIEH